MNEDAAIAGHANALELLRKCMRFSDNPEAMGRLRIQLLASGETWRAVCENAAKTRLTPDLYWRLDERGLLPPIPKTKQRDYLAPAEVLKVLFEENLERRGEMRQRLVEIVATLNAQGLTPILIKGARHLWLEDAPWRTLRDLDLVMPGKEADYAQTLLNGIGYRRSEELPDRPNRHHLAPLFRDDLFGWVEIHRRAANPYAEQFSTTADLAVNAETVSKDGCSALVLTETDHIWHGLLHHQFGHSGFARGLLDFKGLFEFAALFRELSDASRRALYEKAAESALGLTTLELWLAAAEAELGLEPDHEITIGQDARDVAENWIARGDGKVQSSIRYPGYRDMLSMGWNSTRLQKTAAVTSSNRLSLAINVPLMLAPKMRRE